MIQFKYFHTSKGYVGRLSIPRDNYYSTIFDRLRAISEGGETFLYATISSGTGIMMQTGANDKGVFAHGIHIENLNEFPCQYIDKLDRDIDDPESVGTQLPEQDLPYPDFAPSLPSNSRLYQFIPKLVDALIYGTPQRRIILHTDDPAEGQEFLQVLSAILPHDFMMRVGFSIGSKSINTTEIKVPRQGGQPDTVFIKIWIPKITNYRYENYVGNNYIFDAESGRDNYTAELSTFGEALKKVIDTRGVGAIKNLVDSVNPANSPVFKADGSVDTDRLTVRSSNYILRLENNPEVARKLLKTVNCSDAEERSSAATAIAIICDNKPTAEDLATMITLCAKSRELDDEVHGTLINVVSDYGLFSRIPAEAQKQGSALIRETDLDAVADRWYVNCAADKADQMCRALYDLFFKFATDKLERSVDTAHIKAIMLKYFGAFDNSRVSKKCAEDIIGSLFENKELKFRDELLAILLATTNKNDAGRVINERIANVRAGVQKLSAIDQFKVIESLRDKLADLNKDVGGKIFNVEDFPFNSTNGDAWIKAIIGVGTKSDVKAPVSESVDALIKLYNHSSKVGFKKLTDMIFNILFDSSYVQDHLKKFTDPGYERYRKMYKGYVRSINSMVPKSEPAKAYNEPAVEIVKEPIVEPVADQPMVINYGDTAEQINIPTVDQPIAVEQPVVNMPNVTEIPLPTVPAASEPNVRASAARAQQGRNKPATAAANRGKQPARKSMVSEAEKREKMVPSVSQDFKVSDSNRKRIENLKKIRTHLLAIEEKKRKQIFGIIPKLSKCADAYEDFSDKEKLIVKNGTGLKDEAIDDIFCCDKKKQNAFIKACKPIIKEHDKYAKDRLKAAKAEQKRLSDERKAEKAAKKAKADNERPGADDRKAKAYNERPKADDRKAKAKKEKSEKDRRDKTEQELINRHKAANHDSDKRAPGRHEIEKRRPDDSGFGKPNGRSRSGSERPHDDKNSRR